MATGTQGPSALTTTLSVGKNSSIDPSDLDPETLLTLARVMALIANTEQQRRDALKVYEVAMTRDGTSAFTEPGLVLQSFRHGQIVVRLAIELGLFDSAREFVVAFPMGSKYRDTMKVDLLNPILDPSGSRAD